VTFHNQRDFLFFRQHRYIFDSTEKVRLQELGPRFTLKVRGTYGCVCCVLCSVHCALCCVGSLF